MATSQIYAHVQQIEDFINESESGKPTTNLNTEDVYKKLMNKEEKVLDVINNMTEYNKSKNIESKLFVNMSMYSVVRKTFKVVSELFRDIKNKKTAHEVIKEVLKPERLAYVGLFIVGLSLFMLLLTL